MIAGLENDRIPREQLAASLSSRESHFSAIVFEVICNGISDKLIEQDTGEVESAKRIER